ncbi:hypothetical protein TNCV_697891 [Trichonephila clavipes]|nr:hypothetical protein TNCV_697891 [Trichonephila clavipes]
MSPDLNSVGNLSPGNGKKQDGLVKATTANLHHYLASDDIGGKRLLCHKEQFPCKPSTDIFHLPLYPASTLAWSFDYIQQRRPFIMKSESLVVDNARMGSCLFQK